MRKATVIACLVLSIAFIPRVPLHTARGKVLLTNGHTLSGDITRAEDGSCIVSLKNGAVKFEKSEIRKVVIAPGKDRVSDTFMASFRATPRRKAAPRARPTPYDNLITEEARKNDLDPALVKAVIKAESNFNANDRSSRGACGLMQLMPETARILGVTSIYSPRENVAAGTRFLRDMLYLFNGDVELALAAYNAGPNAVKRYGTVPPYRETRSYVDNVNRYYRQYRSNGDVRVYTDTAGRLNITNVR